MFNTFTFLTTHRIPMSATTAFIAKVIFASLLMTVSSTTFAQEVRYSWFEISYVKQDVSEDGLFDDSLLGQTVNISTSDGSGIKFRGSLGTWHNLFAFVDFNSSDITVDAVVSNAQGEFSARDEYDFTAIRSGIGLKWSLTPYFDVYGAVSYDSTDHDFGSFAGEDFDASDKGVGGIIGTRSMFGDKLELRASIRYSEVGDVDFNINEMDTDTLFSVGFGYELIRGLSITGDYETGQLSSWNIGFRLDLDEK